MKVLFVCSGLSELQISPVVRAQGESVEREGINVGYFPVGGKGIFSYIRAVFRLRKFLSGRSYDCIHAHYGLCGIVALLSRRKLPLVVSFMGDDMLGSRKIDGKVTLPSLFLVRINTIFSARFYDHTIVKSERMLHRRLNRQSVSVIPNGVDLDLFKPLDRSRAMQMTGWDPDLRHVVFVSDPSRSEKNYTLAMKGVEQTGRNDIRLHAVNGLQHSMMPFVYNSADALLLTSFHEGSANAVKEAMACNCPVISTDTGDAAWVTGNTPGCSIIEADPLAVARGVELAIGFRLRSGETNGRARIVSLALDSEAVAGRLAGIYLKVTE